MAELEAEFLLEAVLNLAKYELYLQSDRLLSNSELQLYHNFLERRKKGEPIAYIIGQQDFFSLSLYVDKRVLIPRPETELLVEIAIKIIEEIEEDSHNKISPIIDLATGSGAIALSLAKSFPELLIIANDISEDALEVAKLNTIANKLNEQVKYFRGNWLEAIKENSLGMIISNPPYLSEEDLNELSSDVFNFEPILALDGGKDGHTAYLKIIPQAKKCLKIGGWLLLEIGYKQDEKIQNYLKELDFDIIDMVYDYHNWLRIIVARWWG